MANMGWMSEHYVRLRRLMGDARARGASEQALDRLALNLDRARILPGPWTHHIVVDASSGRLYYYGGGKREGSMRVVVGAAETQTPRPAGPIQWAILTPNSDGRRVGKEGVSQWRSRWVQAIQKKNK